ncbi:MAG: prephenate dehydrogenase [Clostridia bacterium]|nr:prephenate dehydrogenase [Clostridia bacterium]
MSKSKILIVGLGLIGGSYAKALKRLGYHISAIDNNPDSISFALDENIIDAGYTNISRQAVSEADAIIFALYPGVFKEWIKDNQKHFKTGALLTDVTGVKSCIVYEIQNILREDVEFIAAHPMAGREVYGVRNSDDGIFRGANYIVTPTEKNTPEAIEWCKTLGRILGFSRVSVLTPEQHDDVIGFVSQLTHVIAVALMTCNDNTNLVSYTGDSFRDLTRIARINENMWSELFLLNKDVLLKQMDNFMEEFKTIRDMLSSEDKDGLCDKMRLSTQRRSCFDKK